MMHIGAGQGLADGFQHGAARLTVDAGHADLDQLMRLEVEVDFLEYGFGQDPVADQHDGTQGVGGGTQGAALLRSNVEFRHDGIVREWPRKNSPKTGCTSILMTPTSNRRNRRGTGRARHSN